MKKIGALLISAACIVVCLATLMPTTSVADEVTTVQGTVETGTNLNLLKLKTNEGEMLIKLDADTDMSNCKNMLPGRKLKVDVVHGNDGYMHSTKIQDTASTGTSAGKTVTGTIVDIQTSSSDVIYFKTSTGNLAIKVNTSTDLSNCKVLIAGNTYTITYSGTGYYKDAMEIKDGNGNSSSTSSNTSAATNNGTDINANTVADTLEVANVNGATATVTGYVTANTTKSILYLNTSGGVMQFKIDDDAVVTDALVQVPGAHYKVYYAYGSDAYLHAKVIKGDRVAVQSGAALNGATASVRGALCSNSSEGLIRIDTESGIMLLKTDKLETVTGGKVLTTGQILKANISYGTDAYWHVTSIEIQ